MRIGVTCYPTVGGSGILATRLGVEFSKKGYEVHFITYDRPVEIKGVDHKNILVHLVSVVEYPLFKYPPYVVSLGSEMFRISEQYDLDLIHVHYAIPHATSALLARMMTSVPYVVTLHGSDVTLLGSDPSLLPVNTFSIDNADSITAVSRYIAEEANNRLGIKKNISIIPNFVDHHLFSPVSPDKNQRHRRQVVLIHISNFRPVKRIQDLVMAMKYVVQEVEESQLVLVGDGPEKHRIEHLVDELNLKRNIIMTGNRRDIINLLRYSDIFILCSEMESAPITLLESMSSGLPVIAAEVGGIPELITNGKNGFLVPPKSPKNLAEKILELIKDKDLRIKIGSQARKTVINKFTVNKVIPKYEEVYRRVIKN